MPTKFRQFFENKNSLILFLMGLMVLLAWFYLLLMTHDMRGNMNMSTMGIGMSVFSRPPGEKSPTSINRNSSSEMLNLSHHHISENQSYEKIKYFGMPSLGQVWGIKDFILVLIMWNMMMVAMMLPVGVPMILSYTDILSNNESGRVVFLSVCIFISGYLIIWGIYSLMAISAQWLMLKNGLITEMMVGTNQMINGSILIIAGLYQWSKLKDACLSHCRTPLQFFLSSWKPSMQGALIMGIKHGAFCVGCCWALMVLMFFFGLMNLIWIAILSIIMLTEKIIPQGELFSRLIGVLLIIWGFSIIATHLY